MKNKIAIVTGAASGMGRATASLLAERGARVVLADLNEEGGRAAADAIGDSARFFKLDVTSEANWIAALKFAKETFGDVNIVVNNAAVPSWQSMEDATVEEWERVFRANALGPMLGCKHALRTMKERGGAIVNVSSNSSIVGMPNTPIYASSKGAVNALTLSIASYCRANKLPVRVNTVIPGGTRSKMFRDAFVHMMGVDVDANPDSPEAKALLADTAAPEDIAAVIVFLASDDARRVQGAEYIVDGMQSKAFNPG